MPVSVCLCENRMIACIETHAPIKCLAVPFCCIHPHAGLHSYPAPGLQALPIQCHLSSCLRQAAPPTLSRWRISAGVEQPYSVTKPSSLAEQRPALRVRSEKHTGFPQGVYEMWPGKRESATAEELFVAVRDIAASRGVAVALEDHGRCVVFNRVARGA